MTAHILEAYRTDFESRSKQYAEKLFTVGTFPEAHNVNAHQIKPGVVYKDTNVTVMAFSTKHTLESYGYRFDTADRSIVISGDTLLATIRRPDSWPSWRREQSRAYSFSTMRRLPGGRSSTASARGRRYSSAK